MKGAKFKGGANFNGNKVFTKIESHSQQSSLLSLDSQGGKKAEHQIPCSGYPRNRQEDMFHCSLQMYDLKKGIIV